MRLLLILLTLFIPYHSIVKAASSINGNIEKIDLNLKDHEAAVTFFALSEGEAVLIQGSDGKNILINTGGKDNRAELESWLDLYKVKEITTLILTYVDTNYPYDQINGLISKYNMKEIFTTPKIAAKVAKAVDPQKQISISTWAEGAKKELLPDLTTEVQFVGNEADEGLDLTVQFFMHRIFFMSSFSERADLALLNKNLEDVNVFKLPNGAKADSLSEKLIQYLNPQISVLSSVDGHEPDSDLLYHLHNTWSEIYFTKRHGTITIKFTDSKYEVITIPVEGDE